MLKERVSSRSDELAHPIADPSLWPATAHFLGDDLLEALRESEEADRVPDDTMSLVARSGYLGLAVPTTYEGAGANLAECCAVQMRFASANPGLAIGLNMHLFTIILINEHVRRHRDLSWTLLEAIATQRKVVASAFAEPQLAGSINRSTAVGKRVPGGYRVTGTKTPCSLVARSDLVCLQFQSDDPAPDTLLIALIPTKVPGLQVRRTWDASGLMASESDTLLVDDCFIPDELVFHRGVAGADPDGAFAAGVAQFCLLTTCAYLGMAKLALSLCAREIERGRLPDGSTRSSAPSVQSALGELAGPILALEAGCAGAAAAIDCGRATARGLLPAAIALRQEALPACLRAASGAMELVGGRAFAASSRFSRLVRDMQGFQFHPPTRLVTRTLVGRHFLGEPPSFDVRTPVERR